MSKGWSFPWVLCLQLRLWSKCCMLSYTWIVDTILACTHYWYYTTHKLCTTVCVCVCVCVCDLHILLYLCTSTVPLSSQNGVTDDHGGHCHRHGHSHVADKRWLRQKQVSMESEWDYWLAFSVFCTKIIFVSSCVLVYAREVFLWEQCWMNDL